MQLVSFIKEKHISQLIAMWNVSFLQNQVLKKNLQKKYMFQSQRLPNGKPMEEYLIEIICNSFLRS